MKYRKAIAILVWAFLLGIMSVPAQDQAAQPQYPGYNTLYCSGFITDRQIEQQLFVITAQEGGMQNEFVPGDVIYLNKGASWIVNPSGEYQVIRPVKDFVKMEAFKGQFRVIEALGQMYKEIGRIRVNIVHENSATATVLHACESITIGDLVIPFNVKPAPPLRPSAAFDRFAPPTGKTGGAIITGKEFVMAMRTNEIAYLDIGSKDGVAVGQYYRIYRPYEHYASDRVWRYGQHYLEKTQDGMRLGFRLTPQERAAMPREVLGEMIIIQVEGKSATALITYSQKEVYVGDLVELE